MIEVTVTQLRANFADYMRFVRAGETVVVSEEGKPVAEVKPISAERRVRPCGLCKGEFHVPDDLDDPLPRDIAEDFEGR